MWYYIYVVQKQMKMFLAPVIVVNHAVGSSPEALGEHVGVKHSIY